MIKEFTCKKCGGIFKKNFESMEHECCYACQEQYLTECILNLKAELIEKDRMVKWQKDGLFARQVQIENNNAVIKNLMDEISYFSSKFRYNDRFTKTGVWQKDLELYINECMINRFKELKNVIERKNNGTRNSSCSLEYKDGYSGCCCNIQSFIDEQIEEMGKEIDYERIPTKGINYDA